MKGVANLFQLIGLVFLIIISFAIFTIIPDNAPTFVKAIFVIFPVLFGIIILMRLL